MQAIHDHVTVSAVPPVDHEARRGTGRKRSSSQPPVLMYVVENTGLRAVAFRADFSGSSNIALSRPDTTTTLEVDGMTFECTVYPFERRLLVAVAKRSTKERAMIRVTYELLTQFEPDVADITSKLERNALDTRELEATGLASYSFSPQVPTGGSSSSWPTAVAFCADVSRYFSLHGDLWLDPTFPTPSSSSDVESAIDQGRPHNGRSIPLSMCAWRHLHSLVDDERLWRIFQPTTPPQAAKAARSESASSASKIVSGLPDQQTFTCALAVIAADIDRWRRSWFSFSDPPDSIVTNVVALPVRLCQGGVQWTAVVIDLMMPVFPLGNGIVAPRTVNGELWPALLHKAYAKLRGGYDAVTAVPTVSVLCELLGVPCVLLQDLALANESKERALQRRLQQIFKRQARMSRSSSRPILVATFAVESTPTIAPGAGFSILSYSSSAASSASDLVVLGDVDGVLQRAFGDRKLVVDPEMEMKGQDAVVAIAWRDFVDLQPSVSTLLPSVSHVRRVRSRFLWRHQAPDVKDGSRAVVVAISVATLSTVVIAGHLVAPVPTADTGQCRLHGSTSARLQVCMCPADGLVGLQALDTSDGDFASSSRGLPDAQVVKTLAPGEYIVAICLVDGDCNDGDAVCSCRHRDIQGSDDGEKLTVATKEANLAQLFKCLDREMQGLLTARDLSAVLSLPGQGAALSPEQVAAIDDQLIDPFGSPVNRHWHEDDSTTGDTHATIKRGLQLADLREVYRSLARGEQSGSQQRYQELVWHDLLELLGSASPLERQELHVDDLAALICCISSDSRLVDCVQLPTSSLAGLWPTQAA